MQDEEDDEGDSAPVGPGPGDEVMVISSGEEEDNVTEQGAPKE